MTDEISNLKFLRLNANFYVLPAEWKIFQICPVRDAESFISIHDVKFAVDHFDFLYKHKGK